MTTPVFITGNQNKADYLARLLNIPIEHRKIDLDEIQSKDIAEVVAHKVKQAYDIAKQPVLVEDTSLGFSVLDGLPGPFVKFFVDSHDGLEVMCRMLDGFSDRKARAQCMFGYYDGERLELFLGEVSGLIAEHPMGEGGFGWDKIFCPDGYNGKTRAELTDAQYDELYQIIKPIGQVRDFLSS